MTPANQSSVADSSFAETAGAENPPVEPHPLPFTDWLPCVACLENVARHSVLWRRTIGRAVTIDDATRFVGCEPVPGPPVRLCVVCQHEQTVCQQIHPLLARELRVMLRQYYARLQLIGDSNDIAAGEAAGTAREALYDLLVRHRRYTNNTRYLVIR